jgi:hypothetical protein
MSLPLPASRRALLATGLSRQRVDHPLRNRTAVAVFRGVHVAAGGVAEIRTRCRAALLCQGPGAVVAMQTAAVLLGLRWLPAAWSATDAAVHVAVPPGDAHRHRRELRLHRRTVHADEVVVVDGLACMSPARTLAELARSRDFADVLVVQIIDGALRDRRVTLEEIQRCLARMPGERGVARARELVSLARCPVDSPQETSMRLALWYDGIRDLDVGIEICDEYGAAVARGDLGSKRLLIWTEYDGYEVHTQREAFRGDRRGDRWLQRRGWHVMRFVDADLRQPGRMCAEWRAAIADAPRRIAALPPGISPEADEARLALRLGDHGVVRLRTP